MCDNEALCCIVDTAHNARGSTRTRLRAQWGITLEGAPGLGNLGIHGGHKVGFTTFSGKAAWNHRSRFIPALV